MPTPALVSPSPSASFRSLVLPREHGSWALALEPVALGLLVAPSAAGAWLGTAVTAGFLARRPLKLALTLSPDEPRRLGAAQWAAVLAAVALAALFQAGLTAGTGALWPLLLSVPFGAAFLWFDLRHAMREAEAELCGSIAFAFTPAAFAVLDGWAAGPALALAALMLTRSAPTVLTVRAYLRMAKKQAASAWPALAAALGFLAGLAGLQAAGLLPFAAVALGALLALRSAWLLSRFAPKWSARRVGFGEALLGLLFLAAAALAYRGQ